jgi:hypothetical protein
MTCPGISCDFGLSVLHETGVAASGRRAVRGPWGSGRAEVRRVVGGRCCGWPQAGAAGGRKAVLRVAGGRCG